VDFVNPTFRKTKITEQHAWTCTNACFSYDEMACDRHIVATVVGLETVLETFLNKVLGMGPTRCCISLIPMFLFTP